MKYLQIWIGDTPGEKVMNCIHSVLDKVTVNDKYILMSNHNFLEEDFVQWIDINKYIDNISDDRIQEFIRRVNLYDNHKEIVISNLLRLIYCMEHDDVFYVDSDIVLDKTLKFEGDVMRFALFRKRFVDCFLYYSGKNKQDFFKKLVEDSINWYLVIKKPTNKNFNVTRGWIYQKLNLHLFRFKNYDFEYIPLRDFEHLSLGA